MNVLSYDGARKTPPAEQIPGTAIHTKKFYIFYETSRENMNSNDSNSWLTCLKAAVEPTSLSELNVMTVLYNIERKKPQCLQN